MILNATPYLAPMTSWSFAVSTYCWNLVSLPSLTSQTCLRLIPVNIWAHRPKNGRDISPAKRIVEILQKVYVVHALSSDLNSCPPVAGQCHSDTPRASLPPTSLRRRSIA